MPTYPINQPADNAPPYTYTQPIRDSISGVNDHQIRITALEGKSTTTVNVQTGTTYTFVLGDADTVIVRAGNAGAQTYTIPPNSSVPYPVPTSLMVLRYGAGALSLVQGAGVTLRPSSPQTARAQYSMITAIQVAVNEWVVGGDVT